MIHKMERKDLKVIGGVVISAIVVAFVINCLLTYGNIIVTSLTNDSWLNFWGSYISGVFAVIVGYLAIVYSNRNSEKAIKQQERVLIHQQNIKKVDEYNACLRKNLELFNIADLRGIMAGIDHQNLLTSMMSISKMKAQIFATDLQYRYIFEVDTQKEKTELENKYNEWWIKARTGLSTILDMELNFIERVNQNMNDFNSKKHYLGKKRLLIKLLELDSSNEEQNSIRRQEINKLENELEKIDIRIGSYYKDINEKSTSIINSSEELARTVKILFDLSLLLIKEKKKCYEL